MLNRAIYPKQEEDKMSWIKDLSAELTVAQRLLSQVSVKQTSEKMKHLLNSLKVVNLMINRLEEGFHD